MVKSLVALSLALAFGLSVLATHVSAADSTGTYRGSIKCTIYRNDGTRFKTGKRSLTVLVSQEATVDPVSNLNMDFDFFDITLADGTQFDNDSDPAGKAAVGAVSCNNDDDSGTFNFVANASLKKADASNGKAKLKGTLTFTDPDENGTCKWKVERTSTSDPEVISCSELRFSNNGFVSLSFGGGGF
jgi:hypothetical protein